MPAAAETMICKSCDTHCLFGVSTQGDVEGALSALMQAADLAAPVTSTAPPAAAAPQQQTFAVRPGKAGRLRQSRQAAAGGGGQDSIADPKAAAGSSGGSAAASDSAGGSSSAATNAAVPSAEGGSSAAAATGIGAGNGGDGSSGSGKETAVRALLSAGSMLAREGRKQAAADAVRRAVALDMRLRKKFLDPLEAELGQG